MDYKDPPGSSALGIFQARILEWVASSFPRGCGAGPSFLFSHSAPWLMEALLLTPCTPPPLHLFILLASLSALGKLEASVKELPFTKRRRIRIRGHSFCAPNPGCGRRDSEAHPGLRYGPPLWFLRDPAFCWPDLTPVSLHSLSTGSFPSIF